MIQPTHSILIFSAVFVQLNRVPNTRRHTDSHTTLRATSLASGGYIGVVLCWNVTICFSSTKNYCLSICNYENVLFRWIITRW